MVDFELFREELERALRRSERRKGGRPAYDTVLMFKVLVLQTLYTLSDDQTEYQLRDRLSFMRFAGLRLHDAVPDAKTIWLFREQLVLAGAFDRLFERFDAALKGRGYLAMGGQIVDATVVEARRPRLNEEEKRTVKGGGTPADWSPARRAQIDREGRWTLARPQAKKLATGDGMKRVAPGEILVPMFGYKNHIGIDRTHGLARRFTVTHAAAHDGAQLGQILDTDNLASGVWADTAYRSKANLRLLDRRGLTPEFQRPKSRGKPMTAHIRRGNATRARVRSRVEHVFAAEKRRLPGHPDPRPRPGDRQDRARQPHLQLQPLCLARERPAPDPFHAVLIQQIQARGTTARQQSDPDVTPSNRSQTAGFCFVASRTARPTMSARCPKTTWRGVPRTQMVPGGAPYIWVSSHLTRLGTLGPSRAPISGHLLVRSSIEAHRRVEKWSLAAVSRLASCLRDRSKHQD